MCHCSVLHHVMVMTASSHSSFEVAQLLSVYSKLIDHVLSGVDVTSPWTTTDLHKLTSGSSTLTPPKQCSRSLKWQVQHS